MVVMGHGSWIEKEKLHFISLLQKSILYIFDKSTLDDEARWDISNEFQ